MPEKEDFVAMLEEGFEESGGSLQGGVRKGTVVAIENDMVLIDAGLKSEGYIPLREFTDLGRDDLSAGDVIDVFVERMENKNGEAMLSFEKARRAAVWNDLEESHKKKEIVQGKIMSRVKGGFTVDLFGTPAFLPGSQVDVRPIRDIAPLLEVKQPFQILKMDQRRGNIVVSRRAVLEESREVERSKLFETLEEGQEVTGIVKNMTDYGAFIDLGGVDGLLHITDMAWHRVNRPGDILTVGESIQVKVIRFKPESRRISLGLKQLAPDPWDGIRAKYPEKARFSAKVTNITEYGAFLELEPGIEGLAHVSEMSWTHKNIHPNQLLSVSEEVDVMVLQVDQERRRISLGIKQCQDNPWETLSAKHKVGDIVKCHIRQVGKDALTVSLDEHDLPGHIAAFDLDWKKSGEEALADYRKDQVVEARILTIDLEKEYINLGIKQLTKDPFEGKYKELQKNAIVTCTIEKIADPGITVSLPEGIEGFIKRAELSSSREDCSVHRFAQGERIDAMIIKVDPKNRQVLLSIKSREEAENKKAIDQFGTIDSGARLGDILGPAFAAKARRSDTDGDDKDGDDRGAPKAEKDAPSAQKAVAEEPGKAPAKATTEAQSKDSQSKDSQSKETQVKESKSAAKAKADKTSTPSPQSAKSDVAPSSKDSKAESPDPKKADKPKKGDGPKKADEDAAASS